MKKHELKRVCVCSRYGAHCLAHIGAPFWTVRITFRFGGKEGGNDLSFFETPFHVIKSYGGTRNFSSFRLNLLDCKKHKQNGSATFPHTRASQRVIR